MPVDQTPVPTSPGLGALRPAPAGMPVVELRPPVIAESGDPFTTARVLELLARIELARTIRVQDVADRLNATHLDWIFPTEVVTDVAIALRANWIADYRSQAGIVVDDGPYGATIEIEDSSRVDPWIVRQAERAVAACRERLTAFSRLERPTGEG